VAKTLYQMLDLPGDATPEAIKGAYVKLAARLRASGAREQYEAVKQAYDILSDPPSRARYDRQAYLVADSGSADPAGRHWLLSWRGAALALVVAGVAYSGWTYNKREQYRLYLERERLEAQRLADEAKRDTDARERIEQLKLAEDERRAEYDRARQERSGNRARAEGLYRETLNYGTEARRDQLQYQRERDAARREDTERRRVELEQQRRLELEKRHLRELEQTRPLKF